MVNDCYKVPDKINLNSPEGWILNNSKKYFIFVDSEEAYETIIDLFTDVFINHQVLHNKENELSGVAINDSMFSDVITKEDQSYVPRVYKVVVRDNGHTVVFKFKKQKIILSMKWNILLNPENKWVKPKDIGMFTLHNPKGDYATDLKLYDSIDLNMKVSNIYKNMMDNKYLLNKERFKNYDE